MNQLVLLLAAAALLCGGQATNVNKHLKLLSKMNKHANSNALPKFLSPSKKFIALLTKPPAMAVRKTGAMVEITCDALAAPAPSIHWYRNDEPVYEHDQESNEVIDTNPSSLARISSTLLVPRAVGVTKYTCAVVAGTKTTRASSVIVTSATSPEVSERSRLMPLAPRILVQYKVYVDLMGADVALPCRARGHPRPIITWLDINGTRIDNTPRMKVLMEKKDHYNQLCPQVLRSGELVIRSVLWSDMGEYICRATNMFGSVSGKTFVYPARPNETNG